MTQILQTLSFPAYIALHQRKHSIHPSDNRKPHRVSDDVAKLSVRHLMSVRIVGEIRRLSRTIMGAKIERLIRLPTIYTFLGKQASKPAH